MPLLHTHPESLLLGVMVGPDRDRRDDTGVEALDALEGNHEPLAGERPAGALGTLREQHAGQVTGERVPIRLVLGRVLLEVLAVERGAGHIGWAGSRQGETALGC